MPKKEEEKVDCETPTIPEDVCELGNPFYDMYEYQNECIELKKPYIPYYYNPLMGAGDIYREVSVTIKPAPPYLDEQINSRLKDVNRWSDYEITRISKDLTNPKHLQQLKEFQHKIEQWKAFTNAHPVCEMPIKRKLQLKAIEAEKILVQYGLTLAELSTQEAKMYVTDLLRTQINILRDELNALVEKAEVETEQYLQKIYKEKSEEKGK